MMLFAHLFNISQLLRCVIDIVESLLLDVCDNPRTALVSAFCQDVSHGSRP